jgi:hypothetical protein
MRNVNNTCDFESEILHGDILQMPTELEHLALESTKFKTSEI